MFELFAAGLLGLGVPPAAGATPLADAEFEADIRALPGGELFRAIERHYPGEYAQLVAALHRDDGAHGEAQRLGALKARMIEFYGRRSEGLANAPGPFLQRINARQLALIRELARDDVALCAEFAATALIGRFDLPAAYQPRVSALGALMVEASRLGEVLPPDPARATLSDADAGRWYESLLQVGSPDDIPVAAGDADPAGPLEMQCRVGVALYAAIDKLAPEQAANVAAFFLTQTLAEAGAQ
jgi:hypothetical protein